MIRATLFALLLGGCATAPVPEITLPESIETVEQVAELCAKYPGIGFEFTARRALGKQLIEKSGGIAVEGSSLTRSKRRAEQGYVLVSVTCPAERAP